MSLRASNSGRRYGSTLSRRSPGRKPRLAPAAHQQIDRGGDGQIGLAGARRTQAKDQLVVAQRLDIGGLARRARGDPPLARAERDILAPQAQAAVGDLGFGEADRRLDRRQIDLLVALEPVVELRQREPGRLGRRSRTRDRHPVAAADERDAETPLDAVEVLVALAVEQRQQQIVVEFEFAPGEAGRLGEGAGRDRHHAALASARAPSRLFCPAPVIRTGTIAPMRPAASCR
jgi:hypothetical protein